MKFIEERLELTFIDLLKQEGFEHVFGNGIRGIFERVGKFS